MSEIMTIANNEFGAVRVLVKDGNTWFMANDVCAILGIANSSDAVSALDSDETCTLQTLGNTESSNNFKGLRMDTRLVSESGLYALVFKSRKDSARRFRKWVTSEVLPQIRKTGNYTTQPALPDFTNPAEAARAWADEYDKRVAAEQVAQAALEQNEQLRTVIGYATEWKQVKAIEWLPQLLDVQNPITYQQVGKALSRLSRLMQKEIRKAEDVQYGTVNVYHISIIELLRQQLVNDPGLLGLYRKNSIDTPTQID